MQVDDLDLVVHIEENSFKQPWTREQFLAELARTTISRCYVVEMVSTRDQGCGDAASKVAAFLTSWLVADEVHITNVAVSPGLRRKGVARFLITSVLEEIFLEGGRWCQLEVRKSNDAARGLYLELGFDNLGTRRGYYSDGEDAVVMGKEL